MLGSSLLDDVLDRTVIGGYTNVGYAVRSRFWDDHDLQPMDGRTVVVTGATSGLGLAAATGFAQLGASVWLVARDPERGEDARALVAERSRGARTELELCDLSDQTAIRDLGRRLTEAVPRLDVLVNNAGVLCPQRSETADGIETAFAVNVLAGHLMTRLLAGSLAAAAPGRIINVSSGGMYAQRLRADDLQTERGDYDGTAVYARTKRAEVILTQLWAERLRGVVVHAMHPGWADTPGVSSSLPTFYRLTRPLLRTAAQGADTIVWLGSADEPARTSGGFWHDRRRRPVNLLPGTRESSEDRQTLWAECERLTGAA
ncbi:MAG: SDR family NAD(P)-dependent oxidoreductase [Solirubrobacteraceae bacterium]